MVRKILIAHDGSEHARKAFDLAANMACTSSGELQILYVTSDQPLTEAEQRLAETEYATEVGSAVGEIAWPAGPAEGARIGLGSLLRTSRDVDLTVRRVIGRRIVADAAEAARSKGVTHVSTAVEAGDPAGVILRQAESFGADLLVVGSRGLGNIAGILLGSVSHKVANAAKCSVLIVK
jgi:nucleotide-binding universal stress UspA family protein